MGKLQTYRSERIYWAVEQVEREAGDINDLRLDDNLFYIKSEVDDIISKLEAENRKLKASPEQIMKELFDKVLIYPHEKVRLEDAYKLAVSLKNTKRALWLARALRARDKAFEYHFKNNVEMCAKWDNVYLMLMTKAEEYK